MVERGDATHGEGAAAVTHVTLDVTDKLIYLLDELTLEYLVSSFRRFAYEIMSQLI